MKAVILAGGRGTRLAPVTHGTVPKPMAELLGAPMLEHIVALLKRCGFCDLCCTTACLPEQIERYFGDGSGFGVRMQYRREESALGTAGAVKNCEDFIAGANVLLIRGDAPWGWARRARWAYHQANLDAWEGRLRLPEWEGGALGRAPDASPERARYACRVYCGAPHRARLMRALTAGLMEAGADLTDGLTVRAVPGGVHIAPCADRAAHGLESDRPAARAALPPAEYGAYSFMLLP